MMSKLYLAYVDIFDNNKNKDLLLDSCLLDESTSVKSLFTLMIDGKSMEPFIAHGSVVVADLSQKILEDDEIYLVYYEQKMWVKRYKKEEKSFVSINPDFSHLVYLEELIHCIGKVVYWVKEP